MPSGSCPMETDMTENGDDDVNEGWSEGDPEAPPQEGAGEAKAEGARGGGEGGSARGPERGRKRPAGGPADDAPVPMDERSETALSFVQQVLDDMDMDCEVELLRPRPEEPNEIQLEITGNDSGRIIGKKGQVLTALQYLTNRVVNRPGLERRYVTVDAEEYRSRRDDTLATMARRLGKQAVTEGKIITFEPMNPRDRRVIHLALAKFEGVVTKSEGEGDDRRVQIIPVRR